MNDGLQLQSSNRQKTTSAAETPEQNHSGPDRSEINHLTHSIGTTTPCDFEILPPINTPKASDRNTWNKINEEFAQLHEVHPIYKLSDQPSIKLSKLNTFTYSFFKTTYGCKEPKQKSCKKKQKDPEKKKLRQLKRELKREWKKNKDSDCVGDLKKRFFKVTKILNRIRKNEAEVSNAYDFQKQTKSFRKNPQEYAKKLFNSKPNPEPNFDGQKAQDFFERTYSDNSRGMTYQHPPNVKRPSKPTCPFKTDPPTKEEIRVSLNRKRNCASPGPNGIPYLVYKKVPFLFDHLSLILQEMWPNFEIPESRFGVTGLIHKGGPTEEVSNYRPITMTNTDGKILLSVLASRSLSFMKTNGYYDLGVQKGFVNDMAGCAEHTTMLCELLKNAKQTNRQITVCWTDLENAFGSLRHDLLQFALDWYHFPVQFRQFVQSYYEGLYIKVRTSKWTTEPVALLMGIFQGCPLSVQLFNIVWNIALDMIQSAPAKGYNLKEAGIEKRQLAYVDDHTITTSFPEDAQHLLNTLDSFLSWTDCMKAKPQKCRSLSFKVFRKGVSDQFTPVSETRYSAYDPKLCVSGQSIPFLGDEPFKFLGRKISAKKNGTNRAEIKESFIENLEITNKANITGPMKVWLYNHYIIAFITWPFMIYDLPISYGEELKAVATKYLKRWLGVTKSITDSVLYRSKDHFGLGLTDLVTHLKKMQVCRMHMHKYSQDDSSKMLYEYMRDRDKPPVNGLGIPLQSRIWKPTNALEKAERNFYLDNIAIDQQQCVQRNTSKVKVDRHNTLKRIEKDDEEKRLSRCYSYALQGDWLSFDAVLKADLSWNSLIYTLPQELVKFLLNSTHNVLPTADNLKRWGKAIVDMKCALCGFNNPTLKHTLNGCPMALKQGRYTWRHDSILLCLVGELQTFLRNNASCPVTTRGIRDTFIKFVKEGKQPGRRETVSKSGILFTATDWVLAYDSPQEPLVIPHHIAQTSLRPDIILYSNNTKQILMLELTVPMEDNIVQRHLDKENKYARLIDDIELSKWKGHIFGIEIGSRGYVAKSFGFAMTKLGLKQNIIGKLKKAVSLICMRCSYSIYLSRKNETWRPWETQYYFRNNNQSLGKKDSENCASGQIDTFGGFDETEIERTSRENKRKLNILYKLTEESNTFEGFDAPEIRTHKIITKKKTDLLKGVRNCKATIPYVYHQTTFKPSVTDKAAKRPHGVRNPVSQTRGPVYDRASHKIPGLINLGNSCYMNSVMQCLNCSVPFVKYFTGGHHLEDINSLSSYGGIVARLMGDAFNSMSAETRNPVSLQALKSKVGELNHQFSGLGQQDSHEFLGYILNLLHEDLVGGRSSVLQSYGNISSCFTTIESDSQLSFISVLFQGEQKQTITCSNCHRISINVEPFFILSLSLPANENCTLEQLLQNYFRACSIDYTCQGCGREGTSSMKRSIHRMPPVLLLHLKRFEYSVSARKKDKFVDFQLEQLSLKDHTSEEHQPLYNLRAVSNHYGTMNGGHYTSYCKSPQDDVWYSCDDKNVTRLKTSVKTSAAYLLFYDCGQIEA